MYNDIILNRLQNLKYLSTIKKSNISITSKRNKFHDMVKFYARIDKDEIIQKISFKATGCTYFLVYCDYFCELVEGKNIKNALKINSEKLESLNALDDSRKHVVDIILNTFALLIKKYRKGVEKGKIKPCDTDEVVTKAEPVNKTKKANNSLEKIVVNMTVLEKKKPTVSDTKDITKIDKPNNIVDNKNNVNTENNVDDKNINVDNKKVVDVDKKDGNSKKIDKKFTKKDKTKEAKSTEKKSEKTPVNTSATKVKNNHVDNINHINEILSKQNDTQSKNNMKSTSKQGVQQEKTNTSKQENVKHLSEMLGKLNHNTPSTNKQTTTQSLKKSSKEDTKKTQNESSPKDDKFKLLLSKIIKK